MKDIESDYGRLFPGIEKFNQGVFFDKMLIPTFL